MKNPLAFLFNKSGAPHRGSRTAPAAPAAAPAK